MYKWGEIIPSFKFTFEFAREFPNNSLHLFTYLPCADIRDPAPERSLKHETQFERVAA